MEDLIILCVNDSNNSEVYFGYKNNRQATERFETVAELVAEHGIFKDAEIVEKIR